MSDKFRYFYVEQKSEESVGVQCLFETITPDVEEEANSIFSVLSHGTKFNIHVYLKRPIYLTSHFIISITTLARQLRKKERELSISGAPESLTHYLERFSMEDLVRITN